MYHFSCIPDTALPYQTLYPQFDLDQVGSNLPFLSPPSYSQLKHCCVDDPNDLCNVNIAAQDLTDAREEDFELFQNVVFINAGENLLHFGKSHTFLFAVL